MINLRVTYSGRLANMDPKVATTTGRSLEDMIDSNAVDNGLAGFIVIPVVCITLGMLGAGHDNMWSLDT